MNAQHTHGRWDDIYLANIDYKYLMIKFNFQSLMEQNKDTLQCILVFARMNPPHIGHQKLIQKVNKLKTMYSAKDYIVLSIANDKTKNPLPPKLKLKWVKLFFPDNNIILATKETNGLIQQIECLKHNYKHIHIVCGEDRISNFKNILHKYNMLGLVTLHSAGKRNKFSKGVIGISGTKMRQYVKERNFFEFFKGIPKYISFKDAKSLYNDISDNMGITIKENFNTLFEQFSQGYPITPDGGPGDNPDPVKEKDVDWNKIKYVSLKKAKKWSGFKTKLKGNDVVGSKIGTNQGSGIGQTYDTRYNGATGLSGIGDPAFRESIDSPYEYPFLPAYGISGSGNKDQIMTMQQKVNQNDGPSSLKKKQKLRDLRKELGVPIG